jgi:hypothetical protein
VVQRDGYATSIFADDMTREIVGHSAASRKYPNKQEFIDEVLAPFGARFGTEEPFRPVTIRASMPTTQTAASSFYGTAEE